MTKKRQRSAYNATDSFGTYTCINWLRTLPHIRAWAQEAGWMWQIPTQFRYGCGYVFSDEFRTPDEAVERAMAGESGAPPLTAIAWINRYFFLSRRRPAAAALAQGRAHGPRPGPGAERHPARGVRGGRGAPGGARRG